MGTLFTAICSYCKKIEPVALLYAENTEFDHLNAGVLHQGKSQHLQASQEFHLSTSVQIAAGNRRK